MEFDEFCENCWCLLSGSQLLNVRFCISTTTVSIHSGIYLRPIDDRIPVTAGHIYTSCKELNCVVFVYIILTMIT